MIAGFADATGDHQFSKLVRCMSNSSPVSVRRRCIKGAM